MSDPAGMDALARDSIVLKLPPDLRSVSQARAKLGELATIWGCPEYVLEDARVVISELMSNGVLHARTELQVIVALRGQGGLRVEVHDASSTPVVPPLQMYQAATSVVDRPGQNELLKQRLASPTATGRGLSIVAALASTWGWFADAVGGKVVWAEIGTAASAGTGATRSSTERPVYPVRPVRLIAAPIRLLRGSEDHFDDLFRELQMARLAAPAARPSKGQAAGLDDAAGLVAGKLAPLAEHVRVRLARMREPLRRAIWEAARRGDRLIDINLLADAGMPEAFEMSEELLRGAAQAAGIGFLLTEPPPPEVVAWRRWLRREIEDQIAGKPPRACPFPVAALPTEDAGRAWERLDEFRGDALKELRSALTGDAEAATGSGPHVRPGSPDDKVMVKALELTMGYVGARRSVLCGLAADNETVTFDASVGFSPVIAEFWRASSLSADLPSSEAIRTARPVLFRTFAELDERYPIFLSTPSEKDPALACVPLVAGGAGNALGCLVLGFPQARDFSPPELAFFKQLASELANYLANRRHREARKFSLQRKRALDRACATIRDAPTKYDVLKELVGAIVAFITEGVWVHLVEDDGKITYMLARHRDPEREAVVVELLQKPRRGDGADDMVAECARSGQRAVFQVLSEEAMAAGARDDDDLALLRRLAIGSVGVLPMRSGGRLAGVVSFSNDVGRFITDEDLDAVRRLTDLAGESLGRLAPESRCGR